MMQFHQKMTKHLNIMVKINMNKNQQLDDVISSKNYQVPEIKVKMLRSIINCRKKNHKDVEGNNNPSDEPTRERVLLDDVTSDKSNQKINQCKDALMNSTKNPAPEIVIHKDVEDYNNSDDKASNKLILPDDATSDKSNQNANEVQDTPNDTNKKSKNPKYIKRKR